LDSELKKLRRKGKDEPLASAQDAFVALFIQMARFGQVPKSRFKSEMRGFHAFRDEICGKQIRFPCFQDGNKWIITHGFFKPGARRGGLGEWPPTEVDRAVNLREVYFERKRASQPSTS
jgi:hypothetical protein